MDYPGPFRTRSARLDSTANPKTNSSALLKGRSHQFRLGLRIKTCKANEHDARMQETLAEHKFSKILVGSQ
jgi:hypothetical protein